MQFRSMNDSAISKRNQKNYLKDGYEKLALISGLFLNHLYIFDRLRAGSSRGKNFGETVFNVCSENEIIWLPVQPFFTAEEQISTRQSAL